MQTEHTMVVDTTHGGNDDDADADGDASVIDLMMEGEQPPVSTKSIYEEPLKDPDDIDSEQPSHGASQSRLGDLQERLKQARQKRSSIHSIASTVSSTEFSCHSNTMLSPFTSPIPQDPKRIAQLPPSQQLPLPMKDDDDHDDNNGDDTAEQKEDDDTNESYRLYAGIEDSNDDAKENDKCVDADNQHVSPSQPNFVPEKGNPSASSSSCLGDSFDFSLTSETTSNVRELVPTIAQKNATTKAATTSTGVAAAAGGQSENADDNEGDLKANRMEAGLAAAASSSTTSPSQPSPPPPRQSIRKSVTFDDSDTIHIIEVERENRIVKYARRQWRLRREQARKGPSRKTKMALFAFLAICFTVGSVAAMIQWSKYWQNRTN